MKRTKNLRSLVKKIYKKNKKQESIEIGRKINSLTQVLHNILKLPPKDRDVQYYKEVLEELTILKKEPRLQQNFPSFSLFYRYITNPKNGFALEDIKEL